MKFLLLLVSFSTLQAFAGSISGSELQAVAGRSSDEIMREPRVRALLIGNIGNPGYRKLLTNTQTNFPSEYIDGRFLKLGGCIPHDCGGNESYVLIDSRDSDSVLIFRNYNAPVVVTRSPQWRSTVRESQYPGVMEVLSAE